MKTSLSAYAIVRLDSFLAGVAGDANRITVKRVMWGADEAAAEVARLNALNPDDGCLYFSQYTRVDPPR